MGEVANRYSVSHTGQVAPASIDAASVREQAVAVYHRQSSHLDSFETIEIASSVRTYAGGRLRRQRISGVDDL